jgi:hypothetical protein
MRVQEYLNGLLMRSYTINANSIGKFNFSKTFPQPVSSGNVIDLDAFFVGFDTHNPGNFTRTVTVYGAIN